jgi:alpha-glucuronidase
MKARRTGAAAALGLLAALALAPGARADDGYRLWLRYDPIADPAQRQAAAAAITALVVPESSPTLEAARAELVAGLGGLLGRAVPVTTRVEAAHACVIGRATNPAFAGLLTAEDLRRAGAEGYILREVAVAGRPELIIAANHDIGVLYGAFALLRRVQTGQPLAGLDEVSAPRIQRRLLDHWDNLNGFVERGAAGFSLWDWFQLPDYVKPRYRDYARANASVGINGAVLNNVNADPLILTEPYLRKVAALANVFRPYGIRVYLSARFSAPIEIGGLKTADPLDPRVIAWWRAKVDEIYRWVPDFGGFLVKANSEGQPGPQDYHRTHADGANLLADALAPHGGIVMWRAFVYDQHVADDRAKQAYREFQPLDGQFRGNVVVQIKNGPIDFQPREPFHPLFGAMPRTALGLELQITKEYLGGAVHLVYLGPLFQECLNSDTGAEGPGSTVARIVDGSLDHHALSVIAGVANTGSSENWCGHPLSAANWYAFGRLAWDHRLGSAAIAEEWTKMTLGNDPRVWRPVLAMLLASRETAVNYMMPLGLAGIFARGHHYGPGPWVDGGRPDWTSTYYHRADAAGLGFDRTATGSNALAQYSPAVAAKFADLDHCPDEFLAWFHHVPWDHRLDTGRTFWDEFCLRYQAGIDEVRRWQKSWDGLAGRVDAGQFAQVQALLARQEREACQWRDACLLYFQQFSHRPLPAGVEPPAHDLAYYEAIQLHYVPGNPGGL